ncbi:AAA family ATPase [Ammoniphilus resinae]|uniref:ATP-dependent metalloprotease FtsH n=1 Tax=Ammoniphilus resinae TaxID=861532 RepID=A0ABS4GT12_9BACL|nr:AAA family ATPase [Ammoniphilus resinae]MBP1933398.1 ATP-dependent metalloprotease FtsH [Ammoniphilus resinae]
MSKEIVFGMIPALFIFLAFLGVNIAPLLIGGILVGVVLFLIMRQGGGMAIGSGKKAKNSVPKTDIKFEDIGGQERAKGELTEALDFLIQKDVAAEYGIRPLKGILLTGPPGTGKTLMAKAAANYTNSAFVAASGSEFVEMYVGVGAQRIRDLFKDVKTMAEKNNQSSGIVFIDEIDVLGGKREGSHHREYDQTLNQLLTEMDGISTSEHPRILIMAATNRADMLDEALLRPGRFDRKIGVDLPDKKARLQILKIHTKNKPMSGDVNLEQVAAESYGFSGAQLESVTNEAAIYAFREKSKELLPKHFSFAIDKVMMGEKTDRETNEQEKERVAIHELGHAIVSEEVNPNSVSQVTVSPRGQALGYVRQNPQEDHYLYTKEYLEKQIMICLGGAVAEELEYGERSTGSKSDFDQALRLVHTMIDAGLSSLGIVKFDMVKKDLIQNETTKILDHLLEKTRKILAAKRRLMEEGAAILVKEEVLSGDFFRQFAAEPHQEVS